MGLNSPAMILANSFTRKTAEEFGAVKGASCRIGNISYDSDNNAIVEFEWVNSVGSIETSEMLVKSGIGIKNVYKKTVINPEGIEEEHLIVVLTNGDEKDAGAIPLPDLSEYAKKTEIPTKVSELEDADEYAKKSEIPEGSIVDESLSKESKNPVQNKIITAELEKKVNIEEGKSLISEMDLEQITNNKNAIELLNGNAETVGSVIKTVTDMIAATQHLTKEIVDTKPSPEYAKDNILYLVPTDKENIYSQYVKVQNTVVSIGNTEIDLSGYFKNENIVKSFGKIASDDKVPSEKLVSDNIIRIDNKINDIELFKFPNAIIHGEPTINNGQISGLSAINYLAFPFLVDFHNRTFEIDMAFTTGSDVTTQQNIIDGKFGLALAISNGHFLLAVSTDGTTWDVGVIPGTHNVQPNTNYYLRLIYDGIQYKLSYSIDSVIYVDDISHIASASPYPVQVYIGVGDLDVPGNEKPFLGIINMNKSLLKINDHVIWQGMDDAGLATRLATDLENIDDAGVDKIKEIVNALGFLKNNEKLLTEILNLNSDKGVRIESGDSLQVEAKNNINFIAQSFKYRDHSVLTNASGINNDNEGTHGFGLSFGGDDPTIIARVDASNFLLALRSDLTKIKNLKQTIVLSDFNDAVPSEMNSTELFMSEYKSAELPLNAPNDDISHWAILASRRDGEVIQIAYATHFNKVCVRHTTNFGDPTMWSDWTELATIDYLSDVLMSENTSVTDLNEHIGKEGKQHYYVYANSLCANIPVQNGDDFQVEIIGKYDNSCIQIAYTLDNSGRDTVGNIYTRSAQMDRDTKVWTWAEWKEIATMDKVSYSTNEVAIGTWVDGKTIYRKTFVFDVNGATRYEHGIDMDSVFSCSGTMHDTVKGYWFALNIVDGDVYTYINMEIGNRAFYYGGERTYGSTGTVYVTAEYTKA